MDKIGYYRTQQNLSAYDLSTNLGHAKTYFYRIESGEIKLTVEALLEILDVLGVSTYEFFCHESAQDKPLVELIRGLSTESKQIIIELIKHMKK